MENVILVNEADVVVGEEEKMAAHEKGLLHRAFSIFIFNSKHQLLIHKRADGKYHSPGLWTNTCCSHPRPGETTQNAAKRRLKEEMGMECDLKHTFSFIYKAHLDNGLTEYEYDHVFLGYSDDQPKPDPEEVSDWKYMHLSEVIEKVDSNPEQFTEWFKICIQEHGDRLKD